MPTLELPEPMGLVARARIMDALNGVTGIVRVIPETAARLLMNEN
jgi:hypothetical protein